jgi:hypothetical protein
VAPRKAPAARTLLLAKLEQRVPEDEAGLSAFFSSGDFHSLLRLEDAAGHVVERAFPPGDDASVVRTREYAVSTLAALTGLDVRKDAHSEARAVASTEQWRPKR